MKLTCKMSLALPVNRQHWHGIQDWIMGTYLASVPEKYTAILFKNLYNNFPGYLSSKEKFGTSGQLSIFSCFSTFIGSLANLYHFFQSIDTVPGILSNHTSHPWQQSRTFSSNSITHFFSCLFLHETCKPICLFLFVS